MYESAASPDHSAATSRPHGPSFQQMAPACLFHPQHIKRECDLSTQNKETWSKASSQLHSQRAEVRTVPDPSPIFRFLCLERKVARGKIYIDSWVASNVFARRLWAWKTGGLVTKRSGKWGHGLKSQRRSKISDYALVSWMFTKGGLHGRQRI